MTHTLSSPDLTWNSRLPSPAAFFTPPPHRGSPRPRCRFPRPQARHLPCHHQLYHRTMVCYFHHQNESHIRNVSPPLLQASQSKLLSFPAWQLQQHSNQCPSFHFVSTLSFFFFFSFLYDFLKIYLIYFFIQQVIISYPFYTY